MAVTVTLVVEATLGAVNIPLGEIVPFELDQVTAGFVLLLTFAENCWLLPEARLADEGVMETDTAADGVTETKA